MDFADIFRALKEVGYEGGVYVELSRHSHNAVETARQALAFRPQEAWVTALAFRADGRLLATGHDDGTVRLWEVRRRRPLRAWEAHHRPVSALAFDRAGVLRVNFVAGRQGAPQHGVEERLE